MTRFRLLFATHEDSQASEATFWHAILSFLNIITIIENHISNIMVIIEFFFHILLIALSQ